MKAGKTIVRGIRSKETVWKELQDLADKNEMGNLNHLVNKIFKVHFWGKYLKL